MCHSTALDVHRRRLGWGQLLGRHCLCFMLVLRRVRRRRCLGRVTAGAPPSRHCLRLGRGMWLGLRRPSLIHRRGWARAVWVLLRASKERGAVAGHSASLLFTPTHSSLAAQENLCLVLVYMRKPPSLSSHLPLGRAPCLQVLVIGAAASVRGHLFRF